MCHHYRLTGFFKGLGVKAVLDTNTGRDVALLEAAAEFIERYRAAHPEHATGGTWHLHPTLLQTQAPVQLNTCGLALVLLQSCDGWQGRLTKSSLSAT